jgi:hypothetical protein
MSGTRSSLTSPGSATTNRRPCAAKDGLHTLGAEAHQPVPMLYHDRLRNGVREQF